MYATPTPEYAQTAYYATATTTTFTDATPINVYGPPVATSTIYVYGLPVGSDKLLPLTKRGPLAKSLPRFATRNLVELEPHLPAAPVSRDRAAAAHRRLHGERKNPGWRACRRTAP